jgi:hypothetical protein
MLGKATAVFHSPQRFLSHTFQFSVLLIRNKINITMICRFQLFSALYFYEPHQGARWQIYKFVYIRLSFNERA